MTRRNEIKWRLLLLITQDKKIGADWKIVISEAPKTPKELDVFI